jgi:sugar O-acyltransferase (sialic acid O-acetyltransferase NeuD family)
MIPIVIYGSGGHGRETAWLIETLITAGAPWQLVGFVDDDPARHHKVCGGLPVHGGMEYLVRHSGECLVALGMGNPSIKRIIVERTRAYARGFPVLVHPTVQLNKRITIRQGSQLHAGTIATVDIDIGEFVTCNRRVDISHDCVIENFATIAPAVTLTGAVKVRTGADVGAAATCIPGITIGEWSVIGAGAVVTRDVPAHTTAVGVPARIIDKSDERGTNRTTRLELAS